MRCCGAGEAGAVVGQEVAHPRAGETGREDAICCEQSRRRVHQYCMSSTCTAAWNPQGSGPTPPTRADQKVGRKVNTHACGLGTTHSSPSV